MNISYRWLRAFIPGLTATPQEVADRLAMLGAPVDEIVDIGGSLRDIIIADDDPVSCKLIEHVITTRTPHAVVTVNDGDQALELALGEPRPDEPCVRTSIGGRARVTGRRIGHRP